MYIEKRWLMPVTLSLFLLGVLFAVAMMPLGSPLATPSGCVLPAASQAPGGASGAPETIAPEDVVDISTEGSPGTQITTRGFGDVGLQFHDVTINAPITIVHISNEGNNNTTNAPVGESNRVSSEQKDLEANRAGGT